MGHVHAFSIANSSIEGIVFGLWRDLSWPKPGIMVDSGNSPRYCGTKYPAPVGNDRDSYEPLKIVGWSIFFPIYQLV